MLTTYLNHKHQSQGDKTCAEIAATLFIIWGEVFVEAVKLFTEIKKPPKKLVILFFFFHFANKISFFLFLFQKLTHSM